jgi:predicted aconitase
MAPELSAADRARLAGAEGAALQFAMEVVVRAARIMGAPHLIDAGFAHIDACHYYGRAHLDFARFLTARGARFRIPTWTNTVPVSLLAPDPRAGEAPEAQAEARALARLYGDLGCRTVWTCAPYQLPGGPGLGDQIIVGESNAVAYYNSVVGARTNKYGDFLDVCCGLTGRVPCAGLHSDAGRRARVRFDIADLPAALRRSELFCHVLGHLMGPLAGARVPVITGLPADTPADSLKAIAAAGAASGGIAMFHAVGLTPEAPSLEVACGGAPEETITVTPEMLVAARDSLSSAGHGPVSMVALGTPHFSLTEFERAAALIDGRKVHPDVALYLTTSRFVAELAAQKGHAQVLEKAGAAILVDTCTYFAPAVRAARGRVMTNSAKWAYYAPGMLPVEVAFGSLEDCIESAVKGAVTRSDAIWSDQAWGLA